jgi:hypothetical protein
LNFSTTSSVSSTSCSNSIADSEMTSSAAKIGALVRTASASASEGRESISTSRQLGHGDALAGDLELAEHVVDQVVRHGARRVGPLELHQDRRRLRMADPDRQELVAVTGLQQDDRLFADHVETHSVDDHLLQLAALLVG